MNNFYWPGYIAVLHSDSSFFVASGKPSDCWPNFPVGHTPVQAQSLLDDTDGLAAPTVLKYIPQSLYWIVLAVAWWVVS